MTPLRIAAIDPAISTGTSGLLRYASRLIGTSGVCCFCGETSNSDVGLSGTLNPVGKPNDTDNELRLLCPTPDDPRLMDRFNEIL
jgi:hypothetical protein